MNKKGETIVEVLIAIVVLGAALGSALAISNKSTKQTQANHERYQAQLYANEQAELIRQDYGNFLTTGGMRFDYDPGDGGNASICYGSPPPAAACVDVDDPQNYDITVEKAYNFVAPPADSNLFGISPQTYRITVKWDSIVNDGQDRLEIIYGL